MSVAQPVVDTHQPESIRSRYLVTVVTQFLQIGISVLTVGIVPRALGPASYGAYNFISSTSALIRNFLQPSAQQAFFTLSSQDKRSGALTKLYGLMLLVQMVFVFAIIGVAGLAHVTSWLWPDQTLEHILLISLLEWVVFLQAMLRQLSSSKGLVIRAQNIGLVMAVVGTISLLVMNAWNWLNLYTYIGLNFTTTLLASLALGYYLLYVKREQTWEGALREHAREYIQRWWRYASPLILLEYYTPLVAYLSIYLVQLWYGSVEQGYLALASGWSAYINVFTTSAMTIVWREIAHSMAAGNQEHARRVFFRFNQALFFLALVFCLWLSLSSQLLVSSLVGAEYQQAVIVLAIMAFYPLQQAYGQINVAALKAASQNAFYRNLKLITSVPGIFVIYFLLAPPNIKVPGLNLGALGVALNNVVFGLLTVQVYEWASFRIFGLSYWKMLVRKLLIFLLLGSCSFVILYSLKDFLQFQFDLDGLVSFAITSLMYFTAIAGLVLLWPQITGLQREDINSGFASVRQMVSNNLPWLRIRSK